MHFAAFGGQSIQALLDGGADVNKANVQGQTPLHLACMYGSVVSVKMLLDKAANVNAQDKNKCTPLIMAIFSMLSIKQFFLLLAGKRLDVVKLLLDHSASEISYSWYVIIGYQPSPTCS